MDGARQFDQGEVFNKHIKPLMQKYDQLIDLTPKHVPILTLDRTNLDFEKDEDLQVIWSFINN
jgi:hypothetical protein